MRMVKIKSFAKLNLSLNVIGKLRSKLHRIESIVTFVDHHDLIYLKNTKKIHKVKFIGQFSKGISTKNTITKLLEILDKEKILKNQKFEIKVKKNIPQKSGMGGGSMNAVNILNFFLKRKIIKVKKKKISKILNLIGSDLILGRSKKNMILSANGNISKFKKKLNFFVLITKPNFGCSTKLIYSKIKIFSKEKYKKIHPSLLSKNNIIDSSNDLERVAFIRYPKLNNLKSSLLKMPDLIFTRMTGSGSSIVAYFKTKKAAIKAKKKFREKYKNYWCIISKTI